MENILSNFQYSFRILPILSKVYEKCLYKQREYLMENILSNFEYSFRKSFNAQQCLIDIIEKSQGITDKGGRFSALPTDLSKDFNRSKTACHLIKIKIISKTAYLTICLKQS